MKSTTALFRQRKRFINVWFIDVLFNFLDENGCLWICIIQTPIYTSSDSIVKRVNISIDSSILRIWYHNQLNPFQISRDSRVAQGNFTPRPSQIRTWTSRFIRLLPAILLKSLDFKPTQKAIQLLLRFSGVDCHLLRADSSPSLQPHYGAFNTTTGWSAPFMCIDTFPLRGLHL